MSSRISYLLVILALISCGESGTLLRSHEFQSDYIEDRTIQVLLPPSYHSTNESYPVLYMHDGQMLFDSTTTWNGQEWGVDETMAKLSKENKIREAIVVAIPNGGTLLRHPEYFPQKPFESLPKNVQDSLYQLDRGDGILLFGTEVQSDNYLRFITEELKPFVDSTYRTLPDRSNTFIAGSSMGGLISMYAICEYPDVFGGAACLSTHWPGVFTIENNPIPDAFFTYLKENVPDPANHKLYFDYGTATLDALYASFQPVADSIILEAGNDSNTFKTMKFEGDAHDENAWKNRLHIPLIFLLSKD
ncbi:Putative esterase [Ekhidna lutea]|uniref:Putative esterase n=1 Tax=Ekhidna lutea TaxID=447679 RepID=A0A239LX02_EKHLU|nr:alpha/beta hydrolase-fold protein [Ekhidna lutea]SNT34492.1 Putative esterase [Ekhidna lutea]